MKQFLAERVKYEQTELVSTERASPLRAITEHIPSAAVFVVDQDFRYLYAGGSGLTAAGMHPSDFEGKMLGSVVPPELLSQYLGDYAKVFAGESFVRVHPVGDRRYITRGRLVKGINGGRDLALAVSYDVTDEPKMNVVAK